MKKDIFTKLGEQHDLIKSATMEKEALFSLGLNLVGKAGNVLKFLTGKAVKNPVAAVGMSMDTVEAGAKAKNTQQAIAGTHQKLRNVGV